ncbi:MAG: hypothetical protein ACRCWI_06310 [Brevinema sp.]
MDTQRKYLWNCFYSEIVAEVLISGSIPKSYCRLKRLSLSSWINEVKLLFETEDISKLKQYIKNQF